MALRAATLAAFTLGVPGGRIVCSSDCYHGTAKQLREILPQWGVRAVPASFVVDGTGQIRYVEVGYTTGIGLRLRLWLAGL